MLLEILVKTKGVSIQEVPYTFSNRTLGSSKLSVSTVYDYGKAILKLYIYGKKENKKEKLPSARFLSTAARFFTVGTSGLVVNYLISLFFVTNFTELSNIVSMFGVFLLLIPFSIAAYQIRVIKNNHRNETIG